MMAICCLIISSKYNECEEHVPDLVRLREITQQSLTNETVLNYELWALKRMGWKLNGECMPFRMNNNKYSDSIEYFIIFKRSHSDICCIFIKMEK